MNNVEEKFRGIIESGNSQQMQPNSGTINSAIQAG